MTAKGWAAASVLGAILVGQAAPAAGDPDPKRGAVVFALAGGCGCHTGQGGPVGAGGGKVETPFGTFYGTNITPDEDTGIGEWLDEEIVAAIRKGDLPGDMVEAPVMPYPLYAGMSDEDVYDLVAYLRTLPPVRRENRPAEVSIPFSRLAFRLWRLLFAGQVAPASEVPATGVERGRYLADHVAICGDCHTPRNAFGVLQPSLYLAGSALLPGKEKAPNITPDVETGVGSWDVGDLTQLLHSGMKPDFDNVQGLMADVIDGVAGGAGYSKAPEVDLRAIAVYLKTIKPIRHQVK